MAIKKCFQWTTNNTTSAFQVKAFQIAIEAIPDWRKMRGKKLITLDPTRKLPENW